MIINKLMKTFARVLLVPAIVSCCSPSLPCQSAATAASVTLDSVLGTWKGESICVGDRPACKNEVVVYRFEAVTGKPGVVLLLADKIIEGKRVPMGKLEFLYDEGKGVLLCEFTKSQTHGLWQFKVSGDSMEGTLVLLPDRELGRRVKVKRASEGEVPAAPAREMYEGV
jgi:hypothetical protein